MRSDIPNAVCAVVGDVLAPRHTHSELDTLFLENGAPDFPPPGNKVQKCTAWLRRCADDPNTDGLAVLGKVLEYFMEMELRNDSVDVPSWEADRERVSRVLAKHGLSYGIGGRVFGAGQALPVRKLREILRSRDLRGVAQEFERAGTSVETDPPAAITAACAILEALLKTYAEEEGIDFPRDQSLKPLFGMVAKHLNFDPANVQDDDLRRILSGMFSVVDGIGSLRTHSGSAHGRGRMRYKVEPRHARLAVHGAHTLAVFILESWEHRKRGVWDT